MLPEDKASQVVGLGRHLLLLLVDQAHLLFQHGAHQLRAYSHLVVIENLLLDLLATRYRQLAIQKFIGGFLDDSYPY